MTSRMPLLLEWIRAVFISFEFLASIACVGLFLFAGDWLLDFMSPFFTADATIVAAVLAAPWALLIGTWKLAEGLLRPEGQRQVLISWPSYWRLAIRVQVALVFGAMGAIAVVAGWALFKSIDPIAGAALGLGGFSVSAISLGSVAFARIISRDILEGA